jgi:hypothetical protein
MIDPSPRQPTVITNMQESNNAGLADSSCILQQMHQPAPRLSGLIEARNFRNVPGTRRNSPRVGSTAADYSADHFGRVLRPEIRH